MRGMELLNELSDATGLPETMIDEELSRLLASAGKTTDEATLDDLRELLATYLQDVLLDARDSFESDAGANAEVQAAAKAIETANEQTSIGVVISLAHKMNEKIKEEGADRSGTSGLTSGHSSGHSSNHSSGHSFAMFTDLGSSAPDFIGQD